jgi:hypothetical protein
MKAAPKGGQGLTTAVSGLASGIPFVGTLTVTGFQVVNGVLQAVGTFSAAGNNTTGSTPFAAPVAVAGSCQILTLTLGPLHLDLLGLVIDLNQVVLTITAVPGAGNLLGNLLCAIAGLLDQGGTLSNLLTQLQTLLTQLLGAL